MFAAAVSIALASASPAPPVVVTVLDPDGKPAVGAKVWCYPYAGKDKTPCEPKPVVADADGKATAAGPVGQSISDGPAGGRGLHGYRGGG